MIVNFVSINLLEFCFGSGLTFSISGKFCDIPPSFVAPYATELLSVVLTLVLPLGIYTLLTRLKSVSLGMSFLAKMMHSVLLANVVFVFFGLFDQLLGTNFKEYFFCNKYVQYASYCITGTSFGLSLAVGIITLFLAGKTQLKQNLIYLFTAIIGTIAFSLLVLRNL
ncbi:MAG: hypothetical protein EAZ47_09130 [Bacteroidetes bacterium]|nr:MAG: hypothetical protein EAY72_11655 [Bacteroidota bacterium]TAF92053.1 MAG: hypothetical protein EAZ47_09130 [Bacteroidota bacterium]